MAHFAFICHSSQDSITVNRIVAKLEKAGITCWIAPRDIPLGSNYAASIVKAIKNSTLLVFIYTKASNDSEDVVYEIEKANALKIRIIPFKVVSAEYSDSLEYYLRTKQSINALDKSLDEAIDTLIKYIDSIFSSSQVSDQKPLADPLLIPSHGSSELPVSSEINPSRVSTILKKKYRITLFILALTCIVGCIIAWIIITSILVTGPLASIISIVAFIFSKRERKSHRLISLIPLFITLLCGLMIAVGDLTRSEARTPIGITITLGTLLFLVLSFKKINRP
jgi:TIR domain-containing protein